MFDEAIASGKARQVTYLDRSSLRKQTQNANHIDELKARAAEFEAGGGSPSYINYALAKEYEDLGRVSEAFAQVEKAAAQRRRGLNYSVAAETAEIDDVIAAFPADCFDKAEPGYPSDEPIFILGLPRSGSSLLERFIARHSDVYGVGELQNFTRCVRNATSAIALKREKFRNVRRLDFIPGVDRRALGRNYIDSTRPITGHTPRFTDKLPGNFINIGLIATSLPNARIVHIYRNPMDACYAVYKQSFAGAYYFSYDLEELASYYTAYRRLMTHWDTVLPGRIIHVAYESLVDNTETVVRDTISKLGLAWDDACLDNTASADPSMTASAVQVRQPVYASSVGKWRKVEEELAPLRDILTEAGIDLG